MKTTVKILPLVFFAIITMSLTAKAHKNPEKKGTKIQENHSIYNMPSSIRGPVLSTKNYVYESFVKDNKSAVEIIFITDNSKVTLKVDEKGNYKSEVENFKNSEIAESNKFNSNKKSVFEKFRSNLKDFFKEGMLEISETEQSDGNSYSFDHLREDKYFKSDYEFRNDDETEIIR